MTILTGDLAGVSRNLSDTLHALRATLHALRATDAVGGCVSASASWTDADGVIITLTLSAGDPPDDEEDDDE